jgi:hypothetical protein
VGFEPTRPFRVNALAGRRLKPLGHPSNLFRSALVNGLDLQLPRQGSNLDSSDPESDVLPVTPRGIQSDYSKSPLDLHPSLTGLLSNQRATGRTRTDDPVITNDVLYQLSYGGGRVEPRGVEPLTS